MIRSCVLTLVLGLFAAEGVGGAELGRLFLSPTERAALDRARYAAPEPTEQVPAGDAQPTLEALAESVQEDLQPDPPVAVDGFVRRSGGPATVWINGVESNEGNLADQGIDVRGMRLADDRVEVPLGTERRAIGLKAGQRYDPATETISDAYETTAEEIGRP